MSLTLIVTTAKDRLDSGEAAKRKRDRKRRASEREKDRNRERERLLREKDRERVSAKTDVLTMILLAVLDCFDVKGWLVFIFVFLLVVDIVRNRTPTNFPPGPWSVPFLGNVFTGLDFKTIDKVR